ncbi:MAG: B12-binding domain-containing radical SAM protein [Myxococcota bacterium]
MAGPFRVLFINPPKVHEKLPTLRDEICFQDVTYVPFPMRLATAAAQVRALPGVEAAAIDATALGMNWEALESALPAADVVVFQSAAGLIRHDMRVAEMVKKKIGPHAHTILIESVVSPLYPERILKDFPALDFIVRGQLEAVVPPLVAALSAGSTYPSDVAGLAYRDARGVAVITGDPQPTQNLDAIPFMAYDLFPMARYTVGLLDAMMHEPQAPGISLRTTRDCPFGCAFCIIGSSIYRGYDRRWRSMSVERTVAEIEHVVSTYGIRRFFFWDEVFTMDPRRAHKVCDEIIARDLDIEWRCLTRIDLLNPAMIEKMAKAGCRFIEFGIESGNQEARNEMNKTFTDEKAVQIVGLVREAGIRVNCDLIVGMPWETRESLEETIAMAKRLKADNIHLTSAFPYPGTRFHDIAEAENLLRVDDMYELMLDTRVRVDILPIVRSRALTARELYEGWNRARKAINRHYFVRNLLLRPRDLGNVLAGRGPRGLLGLVPKGLRFVRESLL